MTERVDIFSDGRAVLYCGDCLDVIPTLGPVDLVFGSPPYEDARTYGIDFKKKGQAWVDWMVKVFGAAQNKCGGVVGMVVEGRTENFRWTATPALLMADLHRAGFKLRKPPIYERDGIPGSGGPDWLKNRYEFVVCTSMGKLPWSDNTAMGSGCAYPVGGAMSCRTEDGRRRNATTGSRIANGQKVQSRRKADGSRPCDGMYTPPEKANPGNIIDCGAGGGNIGNPLAHENEAPFPEKLAEFFIRSFCPPGGTVLDPFCGSSTTLAVAMKWGRKAIGIDVRQSQIRLSDKRIRSEGGLFA
ncbi:MAG: site-specific DNA-methyltransferase [Chloroflexi bacterium]|nr:site-specific DNA-methyltransferase [Chloroflexota bacterium]